MKSAIIEIKNLLDRFNSRFKQTNNQLLDDRSTEIIQSEAQKEKIFWGAERKKKSETAKTFIPTYTLWKSQKERRDKKEQKDYLKK